jgi:hypothetical protein
MTSKWTVLGLALFALGISAALLVGMAAPRADSLVARELTIVDAQGRPRISLRVNDQGTAGISLFHPDGQSLISILADEKGASVSMGTADGKPRAKLSTDVDGTPSLDFFDAQGAKRSVVPATSNAPSAQKKAADGAKERGPGWLRMKPSIYQEPSGTIAAYAVGVGEEGPSMNMQRTMAPNTARTELAILLQPHVESTLTPAFLSAADRRHPLGTAKDAIAGDKALVRSLAMGFVLGAQQIDSYLDESDLRLYVLLRLELGDALPPTIQDKTNAMVRDALQARAIELTPDVAGDLQAAVAKTLAAMKKVATPKPIDPSDKGKGGFHKK